MSSLNDDISSNVLRQMKAGGFDFTRIHPIEFYAVFPDEAGARRAAGFSLLRRRRAQAGELTVQHHGAAEHRREVQDQQDVDLRRLEEDRDQRHRDELCPQPERARAGPAIAEHEHERQHIYVNRDQHVHKQQ